MKKILVLIFLTLSFSSFAYSGDWYIAKNGLKTTKSTNSGVYAQVYNDVGTNLLTVGFRFFHEKCSGNSSEIYEYDSINVNGTLVKAKSQCVDDKVLMVFPATEAGANHIHNEFYQKNRVNVDGIIFSAIGFREKYYMKDAI